MFSCRHAVLLSCFHAVMLSCCTNHSVGCPCKSDDSKKLVLPFRIFQTPFFPKLHTSLEPLSSSLSSLFLSYSFFPRLLSFSTPPSHRQKNAIRIPPASPWLSSQVSHQLPVHTCKAFAAHPSSDPNAVKFHPLSVATAHRASRLAQLPSNS